MEFVYQVEALKDDYEELEENYRLSLKELKTKTRMHEALKRDHNELVSELASQKSQFEQQSKLNEEETIALKNHNEQLLEELERHKKLLEESRTRLETANQQVPVADEVALARETNKQTREYHYRWKMAEQENAVLQTSVNRLENQVVRFKESLTEAEKVEAELKAEKRKLLRELREFQSKVEELETNNSHLQKRLDRIRSRNLLFSSEPTNTNLSNGLASPTSQPQQPPPPQPPPPPIHHPLNSSASTTIPNKSTATRSTE